MNKIYTLLFFFIFTTTLLANNGTPEPPQDSISTRQLGHQRCTTFVKINCVDRSVQLSAWQVTLSGAQTAETVNWDNGSNAHQITVTPPGSWDWDDSGYGCDHHVTQVSLDDAFFNGVIDITGPQALCYAAGDATLEVNTQGYNFTNFDWQPEGDQLTPNVVSEPGTYTLSVFDAYGCPFMDSYNLPQSPPIVPQLAVSNSICPEGDTAYVNVVQTYASYSWSSGESTEPLLVTEPGTYEVTVTDNLGCTGVNTTFVPSAGVQNVNVVATAPSICPGQLDTLRITGGGFSQIQWSNGGSGITNIVNQAGVYDVTVTNGNGCTATTSITVGANQLLTPQIANPTLCVGGTAALNVTGGTFANYNWSTGQTTSGITINSPGTYTVSVYNGAGTCPAKTSITVNQAATPAAQIAMPPLLTCAHITSTINASASNSTNANIAWSTTNGNIFSDGNTLTPVVNAPGTYLLTLTNSLTGCTDTAQVNVQQNTMPPVASAGPAGELTCAVTSTPIGPVPNPSNPNYLPQWSTTNGSIQSGVNTWNPVVNMAGTYGLIVTDSTNGCTASYTVNIADNTPEPVAAVAQPSMLSCTMPAVQLNGAGSSSGSAYSYLWSTTNGALSGPVDGLTAMASGSGTYQLLVTHIATGCTATATTQVTSNTNLPNISIATPDSITCVNSTVTLNATGSSTGSQYAYSWTTSNGTFVSGQTTLQPVVSAAGTYTFQITDNNSQCTATVSIPVVLDNQPPAINVGQPGLLNCNNPAITLSSAGSSSGSQFVYQWTTSNGNIVGPNNQPTVNVNQIGTYQLSITNTVNGCTSTAVNTVTSNFTAPNIVINPAQLLTCLQTTTVLNANNSTSSPNSQYTWTGPTGGISSGLGSLQVTVNQPGVYQLSITNLDNGCTAQSSMTVSQDTISPPASAGPDDIINCKAPKTEIGNASAPGTYTYSWSTADGHFSSSNLIPNPEVDANGTYLLTVTNPVNGCTHTDAVVIQEDFVKPLAEAGNTFELTCTQNQTTLSGTGSSTNGNFTYQWTTNGGNIVSGDQTLSPLVNASGVYQLLVTNLDNGCTETDNVTITQSADIPMAVAGPVQLITCTITNVNLNGNGSTPGLSYQWSTQNGNIVSGAQTLTPNVDRPGLYLLVVTDLSNNCSAVSSVMVNDNMVHPQITAGQDDELTCTVSNLALQANVISSSSTNLAYLWSTPDGQIISGINTLTPLVGTIGTYHLTVTDNSNGCTSTDSVTITEDVNQPNALVATPGELTCSQTQLTLSTTGTSPDPGFQLNWTTTGGAFVSLTNPYAPVVNKPGVYQLSVLNPNNGCTAVASVTVEQNTTAPNAEAGISATLNCNITSLQLNGAGSSTGNTFAYQWTTLNGSIQNGATSLTPVIIAPGKYYIQVTDNVNDCIAKDSVTINQDIVHPALQTGTPAVLTCVNLTSTLPVTGQNLGATPTIQWSTSNGQFVGNTNTLMPQVNQIGQYALTVTNPANGCSSTTSLNVIDNIVLPQVQIAQPDTLNCSTLTLTITGSSNTGNMPVWSTTNGNLVSGANTFSPTIDEPGVYLLTVTAPNGCSNSATISVAQETSVPTGMDLDIFSPLCSGEPGMISINQIEGGVEPFQYSINGQAFKPLNDISDLDPGEYDLVIRDRNGCTITQEVTIPEPIYPAIQLPPSFELKLGESADIQAWLPSPFTISMVDTVLWTPNDGLTFSGKTISDLLNPTAKPLRNTKYTATVISEEGCKTEASIQIYVNLDLDIYAPNVISPSSPKNSTFTIFSSDLAIEKINWLQIFDRWGTMVFENRDFLPNENRSGWTGDYKSQPVNPAVFVWQAEVKLITGEPVLLKGDVTVLR